MFAGARPNMPKAWTLLRAVEPLLRMPNSRLSMRIIHSGQHYDKNMGKDFAELLDLRLDGNLRVGSGISDADQLSMLISRCDATIEELGPMCVIVMGDANTSLAAAIVSSRRGLPVIHLEAGLRSRAWDPEEINRRAITACSSYHLAPSRIAVKNLRREGIPENRIYLVGNAMAEAFIRNAHLRNSSNILTALKVKENEYILVTVHKPLALSRMRWLRELLDTVSNMKQVILVCHPHTQRVLGQQNDDGVLGRRVKVLEPLAYGDFGCLMENSYCVVTDSSGVQEETTVANHPCITIGGHTARPDTVIYGSNNFVGFDLDRCMALLQMPFKLGKVPEYWDEHVSTRIREVIPSILKDIEANWEHVGWTIRPQG